MLKWIKVLMLELLYHGLEMARVGFHWRSCVLLMTIWDEVNWYATLEVPPADLLHDKWHDKWHESNCENDAAKGFKQSSVANLRCTGKPEATDVFWMKKQNSSIFRCTGVSSANVIWFVMTDCALHICQSHLAIRLSRWYPSTYVWVWDTARLFVAKQELLHAYGQSSDAPDLQP